MNRRAAICSVRWNYSSLADMPLKHFTLHLDDEDPEDVPLIHYLNRFKRKRKVSNELRNAMLAYLVVERTRRVPDSGSPFVLPTEYGARCVAYHSPGMPPNLTDSVQKGATKAIEEARRMFLRRG